MATKKTPNAIDVHVGARVRMARNLCGISQERLGQLCGGITFQQIQKYEKGTNRIGSSRMVEIANALGQKVSFFFEGLEGDEDNAAQTTEAMQAFRSPHGSRLLRTFLSASEAQQKQIANVASSLVSGTNETSPAIFMP